jgi:hypothetical protein
MPFGRIFDDHYNALPGKVGQAAWPAADRRSAFTASHVKI